MSNRKNNKTKTYTPTRGNYKGHTFSSYHAYRNQKAKDKGFKNYYEQRHASVRINSEADLQNLSVANRDTRISVLDVVGIMRRKDLNASQGVREHNRRNPNEKVTIDELHRWGGKALVKKGGRWKAKPYDRLYRIMRIPEKQGAKIVEVRDSRTASKIARYYSALGQYLETGDDRALRKFRNQYFTSNKLQYRFITDPDLIEELAAIGEFQFESIYELLATAESS